jgi:hypothetical protein
MRNYFSQKTTLTVNLLGWISVIILISGCVIKSNGSNAGSGNGGAGSTTSPIAGGDSSSFTFQPTDFYVDVVAPPNTKMYLHQNGDWTKSCSASQSTPNQDLVCILEIEEADLYDLGITFSYNVPSTSCSFLEFYPYYYYQFQAGQAPTAVNETTASGTVTGIANVGGDAGGVCGGSQSCLNSAGTLTCAWDYSGFIPAGPNCCEGVYTLSVHDTVAATTTVTQNSWPGKIANCLAGPATKSQPKDGVTSFPIPLLTFTDGQTLNSTYTVGAPIAQTYRSSNVYAANYWAGPYTVTEANPIPPSIPLPLWPNNPNWVGGGNTTHASAAQPWYQWSCLDDAGDYVNRLRVLVRSWSTQSQFNLQGTPDFAGPQGVPFSDHDVLRWPTWNLVVDPSPPYNGGNEGFGNTYPGFAN